MRAKLTLALSFLIPFTLVFIYVWTTATNYIYKDEFNVINGGLVESYLKGNLTFTDFWRPMFSIRCLGCYLMMIADIKWFSMNSKIFILLIPLFLLGSAFLIYREYRKSLAPERSPEFIAATFIVLTFIIFNVIQWEGLSYRVAGLFQLSMFLIIASFICIELYLTQGRKYRSMAFILPSLAVLGFGWTATFAFAPALVLTFLCYLLTQQSNLTKNFWVRALSISSFLFVIMLIYIFRINSNDYLPNFKSYYLFADLFNNPLEALQFLLTAFGADIIGIDVFFTYDFLKLSHIVFIGLIVVLIYALALIFYFRSRMYEKTYLPFFLIMQVFFFLVFMTIARFGLGDMDYGMSSRYSCVSIFGLVAIVWIFIFVLSQPAKPNALIKSIIGTGFVVIFAGLLLTSIVAWHIQPDRKAYFEKLRDIALHVDTATYEELLKFEAPPEQVRNSLRLLRKHKLNMYNSAPENKK